MLQLKQATKSMIRTFVRVSNGSLLVKNGTETNIFNYVSGAVSGIALKEHCFDGKKFENWHLLITDEAEGESYDLSFGKQSSAFRDIVRSLASDEGLKVLGNITIDVYKASKGSYTNATVSSEGRRIPWIPERIPPVRYVSVGQRQVPDDTERIAWIEGLVGRINNAVQAGLGQ